VVNHDWSTCCTGDDREKREEAIGNLKAQKSGGGQSGAARHADGKRSSRKATPDTMTGTLHCSLRQRRPGGLHALAAVERTDKDTDSIYIYIYVGIHVPPLLTRQQGDIHAIAVPPPAVDSENRRGGHPRNASMVCVGL
jgi:hypothetical protein